MFTLKFTSAGYTKVISFFLIFLFYTSCKSQEIVISPPPGPDTFKVQMVFVGDVMGHMPVVNSGWVDSTQKYNYTPSYEMVGNIVNKADLAIANLEVPLAGTPYSGYPQFSSPDEFAGALKDVGFDILINANNHALDRGKKGFLRTIDAIDTLKLYRTGTFKDSSDYKSRHPLIVDKNNIRFAFLNYTYGANGYKPEKPTILNFIDTTNIKQSISKAKADGAEIVIVLMHWGNEYERYPSKEQRKLVKFIQDCGASAIIGSHPHVIQPVERYYPDTMDKSNIFPIVYSLGNFLSNQRDRYRDGGLIFEMTVEKIDKTRIVSISYIPAWVYKGMYNGRMIYRIIPPSKFTEAIEKYKISTADSIKGDEFYKDTRMHLNNIPEFTDY